MYCRFQFGIERIIAAATHKLSSNGSVCCVPRNNTFAGDFLPFSRRLAAWGFCKLVETRSRAPFIAAFAGKPCVIVPVVEADRVRLTVFYGALRRLSVARLAVEDIDNIIDGWRDHCRAYVRCELGRALTPLDHNATRNAASALIEPGEWVQMPSLAEIDAALQTSLQALREATQAAVREVTHATA
jgi:hypothetical protein